MFSVQRVSAVFALIMLMVLTIIVLDNSVSTEIFAINSNSIRQVYPWQFVTYIFCMSPSIWGFFGILVFYWFSSNLERLWGPVQFSFFLALCILSHSITSFVFGFVPVTGDGSLYLCLMVAFGFNFPHEVIYIFFILPIRIRILAIISLVILGIQILVSLYGCIAYPDIYTNGLIRIPISLAEIIVIVISNSALLVYYKKIFGQGHFRAVFRKIKFKKKLFDVQLARKKSINKNEKFKDIASKIRSGGTLSRAEESLLQQYESSDPSLCDPSDYNDNDSHCLACDKYGNCVHREIDRAL